MGKSKQITLEQLSPAQREFLFNKMFPRMTELQEIARSRMQHPAPPPPPSPRPRTDRGAIPPQV